MKKLILPTFSKQIILFHVKFELRMFSALIWYAYCPYSSKISEGQIFPYEFFAVKLGDFGAPLRAKYAT